MIEHPGDTAERLYGCGDLARVHEAVWAAAGGDDRIALAMLIGLYVETTTRLVQQERHSSEHDAAFRAFCEAAARRLEQLALRPMGASPQTTGAVVARQVRNLFETERLTATPPAERDDDAATDGLPETW